MLTAYMPIYDHLWHAKGHFSTFFILFLKPRQSEEQKLEQKIPSINPPRLPLPPSLDPPPPHTQCSEELWGSVQHGPCKIGKDKCEMKKQSKALYPSSGQCRFANISLSYGNKFWWWHPLHLLQSSPPLSLALFLSQALSPSPSPSLWLSISLSQALSLSLSLSFSLWLSISVSLSALSFLSLSFSFCLSDSLSMFLSLSPLSHYL